MESPSGSVDAPGTSGQEDSRPNVGDYITWTEWVDSGYGVSHEVRNYARIIALSEKAAFTDGCGKYVGSKPYPLTFDKEDVREMRFGSFEIMSESDVKALREEKERWSISHLSK